MFSILTEPLQLSGADVVRLYARRWDIELGFRLLKDHLNLRLLWSAKPQVIAAQVWTCVILAQLYHALQVSLAAQLGGETFDLSLDLLVRYLPKLVHPQRSLQEAIAQLGVQLGIVRPHTRKRIEVPELGWQDINWPPRDLVGMRHPRYAHKS